MAGIPIPVYLTGAWLVLYWIRHRIDEEAFIKAVERVGSGETYKEPGFKSWRYQQMGEAMERMADRIRKIVDQNVKAERLKADLITNVSHDLKTPLTSIITYTRLMEKEGGLSAESSHYLKVLLDKSTQLKRLTEDLLDAAKITSGNETIHPQQLHFGEMVLQANGEFAEMMDEKNLDIISKVPSETMDAWIDGAKTWRILSNLYANACKYALPQTRVYVDVSENENEVCFCMKNISKEPLNIPPDELMESCSIVVPCYNEEEMIPLFYRQLAKVMDSMKDRLDYENQERAAGETKWSLWKLFRYSVEGIVAFSTAPLSLAFFAGMFVLLTAVLTLLWQQSASRNLLPFIFLTVSSIQLFCMGVAGLYLSRIYLESKKRPIYLVREAK